MKQEAIWDYFQTEGAASFKHSEARLRHLARLARQGRILNIGVGAGQFERAAYAAGAEVYSLDPSAASIERLRTMLPIGDRAQVGYGQQIPFPDAHFDAVVLSEVLEHLDVVVIRDVLSEVARVLRPGGRLLGTVPARDDLEASMVVCPDCGKRFHRWGHVNAFSPMTLRAVLEPPLKVQRIVERPFVTWSALNWKGRVMGFAKLLLAQCGVHGVNGSLVFVAERP